MQNLYLISISLSVFFLVLLLTKKGKQLHDFMLAFWLGLIIINLFGFFRESSGVYDFWIEISSSIVFLYGPVIWFYTRLLIRRNASWKWYQSLQFIPYLLYFLMTAPSVFKGDVAPLSDSFRTFLAVAKIFSIFVYLFLILITVRNHKIFLKNQFSNLEKMNLEWLQFISICIAILIVIGATSQFLKLIHVEMFRKQDDLFLNIALSVLIIIIGYYGFRQTSVFNNREEDVGIKSKPKYVKSGLPEELVNSYFQRIETLLRDQKIYKDTSLSLDRLADLLSLTPNNVSQVINKKGTNFFELINQFRIEEVKQRLINGDAMVQTIESIALESGFASKTSFNRIFKNATQLTPSQYLDSLKKQYHPTR